MNGAYARGIRATFLWVSRRQALADFVEAQPQLARVVGRFVAGRTKPEMTAVCRRLRAQGFLTTVDHLGESARELEQARAATDEVIATMDELSDADLDRNVSLKLTQLGLDLDEGACHEHVLRIAQRAQQLDAFVRLDMEDHRHTDATLRVLESARTMYDGVGIVLQAYLRRTAMDLERLIRSRVCIRLCKGAYDEPSSVAFGTKREVDDHYAELMVRLLEDGNYPALATHDEALIATACKYVERRGISRDAFEFQMLFGVRRDLQERLVAHRYRVRLYVPYGPEWFAYLMRRLAERPANIAFIVSSLVRERRATRRQAR